MNFEENIEQISINLEKVNKIKNDDPNVDFLLILPVTTTLGFTRNFVPFFSTSLFVTRFVTVTDFTAAFDVLALTSDGHRVINIQTTSIIATSCFNLLIKYSSPKIK